MKTPRNSPRASNGAGEQELFIYDQIAPRYWGGVSVHDVLGALRGMAAGGVLNLRIHSAGGDVFEGVAIYNAIRQHATKHGMRVVAHVDGLAASIASVIAMAGDEIRIAPNGFFMIHNASGFTIGDAAAHRKAADDLEKITLGAVAGTYVDRTKQDLATIQGWMDTETWFTAEEAVEAGFADAIAEREAPSATAKLTAAFDLSRFERVPEALRAVAAAAPDVRQAERRLREAGFSRTAAKAGASAAYRALAGQRDAGREPSKLTHDRLAPVNTQELPMSDKPPTNPAPERLTRAQLEEQYGAEIGTITAEASASVATAERARISAIQALAKPGREKLIADAIADPKATAGDVALQIEAAERAKGAARVAAQLQDEEELVAPPAAAPAEGAPKADAVWASSFVANFDRATGRKPASAGRN